MYHETGDPYDASTIAGLAVAFTMLGESSAAWIID
jgi:hypothetical protein